MKLAVIGSRDLTIQNLKDYIPPNVSEIVSGGAVGIDTVAAECVKQQCDNGGRHHKFYVGAELAAH